MALEPLVIETRDSSSKSGGGKGGGGKGSKKSGGGDPEKIKLIVAVAILAVGFVLILWSLGIFDRPAPRLEPGQAPVLTEEEQQEWQNFQEEQRQIWGNNPPPPSGA